MLSSPKVPPPHPLGLVKKPIFSWVSFPLIEFPIHSIFVSAFFILVAIFVFTITHNLFWVILSLFSTFGKPRGLDRFRGQSIRFTKKQKEREDVLNFLDEKIGNRY